MKGGRPVPSSIPGFLLGAILTVCALVLVVKWLFSGFTIDLMGESPRSPDNRLFVGAAVAGGFAVVLSFLLRGVRLGVLLVLLVPALAAAAVALTLLAAR